MANVMDSVSNVLGIDKVNMDGKLILIEEQHDSNANFLLSSIISNALKKNYGICFILFHGTFNHYHNIGMKFGYNLTSLKEKGIVKIVEPMKLTVESMYGKTTNMVQDVYLIIRNEHKSMMKDNKHVVFIMDDFSHFNNFGCNFKDSMYYIRYLRSFLEHFSTLQLCVVIHTCKSKLKNCLPHLLLHSLKCMADLFVKTEPLETGYSSDASGNLIINWRRDSIRTEYNLPEVTKYMYKLSDRQVQIYASGTHQFY